MKTNSLRKKWEAFWGLLIFSLFMVYASAHAAEDEDSDFGEKEGQCAVVADAIDKPSEGQAGASAATTAPAAPAKK